MEKERKYMLWVLLIFLAWIIGSTYVYTCVLKGFCDNTNNKKELKQDLKQYSNSDDNLDYILDENIDEVAKIINIPNNKEEEVKKEIIKEKTFEKRTIKCFTHINSSMKINSFNNIKSEVEKLEIFLNKYYEAGLDVDGIFGEDDRDAVIEFQKTKSLDTDGVVGPKTLRIINAVYCVKNENKN